MTTHVLIFDSKGNDISDEIELKNGKGNPSGWSQHQIWWVRNINGAKLEEKIGTVDSGHFMLADGFTYVKENTP